MPWFLVYDFFSQNISDTLLFPMGFQFIEISRRSNQQQRIGGRQFYGTRVKFVKCYWYYRNVVSRIREIHFKVWLGGSTIKQMPNERYVDQYNFAKRAPVQIWPACISIKLPPPIHPLLLITYFSDSVKYFSFETIFPEYLYTFEIRLCECDPHAFIMPNFVAPNPCNENI